MEEKLIVGYELGQEYGQICYTSLGKPSHITSVSEKAGMGRHTIPMLAARHKSSGRWSFGIYAKVAMKDDKESYDSIQDLYQGFLEKRQVVFEGENYSYEEILEGFITYSLSLLKSDCTGQDIQGIMITIEKMEEDIPYRLVEIFKNFGIQKKHIYIQDNKESFYHFMLSQQNQLTNKAIMLAQYHPKEERFSSMILSMNTNTKPVLVKVEEREEFRIGDKGKDLKTLDQPFREYMSRQMDKKIFSSIYLMGDIFKETWYSGSLSFLSRRGRVFQGENLFVRGACHAAYLREKGQENNQTIYYSSNIVSVNVGMYAQSGEKQIYYPLIIAGTNWFEARKECEFLIEDEDRITLQLNSMDGKIKKIYEMMLPQLPQRQDGSIRLHMRLYYKNPFDLCIEIKDMGFGGFYPSEDKLWREEIHLKEELYGISDM